MAAVGPDAALNAYALIDQVSFYYSSADATSVGIYSGINGTGTLLGTIFLAANAQNGCSDSAFCHWDLVSLSFSGIAQSIQFGSAAGAGFDNVSVNAVPLPAAVWLVLSGLGGLGFMRRKRSI